MKILSMYVDMLLYSSRLARLVPMEYSSSALLQYLHGEGKVLQLLYVTVGDRQSIVNNNNNDDDDAKCYERLSSCT